MTTASYLEVTPTGLQLPDALAQCQDYDTIAMNENDQRIAIAEACGLTVCKHHPDKWERRGTEGDNELYCTECRKYLSDMRVRDYLHDLNSMRDAVQGLCKRKRLKCFINSGLDLSWECVLTESSKLNCIPCDGDHYGAGTTMNAAMAEAFLRTIGKWKD